MSTWDDRRDSREAVEVAVRPGTYEGSPRDAEGGEGDLREAVRG